MPMKIVTAVASKPTNDSAVGFSFKANEGKITITSIHDTGIFASSKLDVGQEILSINGTPVVGMSAKEVKTLLLSIPIRVTIQAKDIHSPPWKLMFHDDLDKLNCARSVVPPLLKQKGVSSSQWQRILDVLQSHLVPAIRQSNEMNEIFRREMATFINKQMTKGYYGFGKESKHERKAHRMVHQSASLANNVTLVSSNVLALANAMLNCHGVLVQLVFTTQSLAKYSMTKQEEKNEAMQPCGLEFSVMD